jgi:transketolase
MIKAKNIRKIILKMIYEAQSGHIGGSFSIADIIEHIYNKYDVVSGKNDKVILSKGHAVPVIYAALFLKGVLTQAEIESFRKINSKLQGHPDKVRLENVVATTGSLGQGLSIAIGHALANKLNKTKDKVFCILGDGEMQEGQIWEAIMLAPKFKLNNFIAILDKNGAQNDGYVNNILSLDTGASITNKIKSFGWNVEEINGNNITEIEAAFQNLLKKEGPGFIVANTTKGKGVGFMEDYAWHAKAPNKKEYERAIKELESESD